MDSHSGKKHPEPRCLDHLSTEELLERLRIANITPTDPNKQSLAEYLNEQENFQEDQPDAIRDDSEYDS